MLRVAISNKGERKIRQFDLGRGESRRFGKREDAFHWKRRSSRLGERAGGFFRKSDCGGGGLAEGWILRCLSLGAKRDIPPQKTKTSDSRSMGGGVFQESLLARFVSLPKKLKSGPGVRKRIMPGEGGALRCAGKSRGKPKATKREGKKLYVPLE